MSDFKKGIVDSYLKGKNQIEYFFVKKMDEERWIAAPMTKRRGNSEAYCWEGLTIRTTEKGLGIFATLNHEPGLMLPYGGVELTKNNYLKILKENPQRISYTATGRFSKHREILSWLDAHKDNYPSDIPKHAWIGSIVNEPSKGEEVNCQLFLQPRSAVLAAEMPHYPQVLRYPAAVVVVQTITFIKAGEELLANYGVDDSHRQLCGYELYGTKQTICKDYSRAYAQWRRNGKHMVATREINKANQKEKKRLCGLNMNETKRKKREALVEELGIETTTP